MSEHGGNIYRASEETGIPVREIIDFSASINPLGVPDSVAAVIRENIPLLVHYPEPFAESLARHLGGHLDVAPQTVLCGNGSTELIYLVVRALAPRRALIPAPTFSEYERACSMLNGTSCVHYPLSRESNFDIDPDGFIRSMAGCDMAFLCNPNNPTGTVLGRDAVLVLAKAAQHLSCYLVVDEAFIDFTPEHSVVHEVAKYSHLIVLRSLTKYYALSGLRIGYGVFPAALVQRMKDHKEPWTMNSLAQKAGIAALDDRSYQERTAAVMAEEKRYLENGLDSLKIDRVASSANYCLLKMNNAQEVIASLRTKGVLVRDCSNFTGLDKTYMRVAVRSREENSALLKELARSCAASS
jgi:threonine-phosphate decarboxylase